MTLHAKKTTEKTAPRKPIRFGRQDRFHPNRSFLQLRPIKEKQEIQVTIDYIESEFEA